MTAHAVSAMALLAVVLAVVTALVVAGGLVDQLRAVFP